MIQHVSQKIIMYKLIKRTNQTNAIYSNRLAFRNKTEINLLSCHNVTDICERFFLFFTEFVLPF
jgi:hypothetical protein